MHKRLILAAACGSLFMADLATAQTAQLGTSAPFLIGETSFHTRYRHSWTSWDHMIGSGFFITPRRSCRPPTSAAAAARASTT